MKSFLAGLLIISSTAFAADSEVDKIYKKYASSLLNIKVGQTSVDMIQRTVTTEDENGMFRPRLMSYNIKSVVLKVEGTKYYQLRETYDAPNNETSVKVILKDAKASPVDAREIINARVEKDTLNYTLASKSEGVEMSTVVSKHLLSPSICDRQSLVKIMNNGDYEMMSETSMCGAILPAQDLKKFDLRNVEFCNEEDVCEVRDMRVLVENL